MKCLMIETKDNKKFLTYNKNYKHIIEYAKAFNAKIYSVKTNTDQKILDLGKLVIALCDKNYKIKDFNFEILDTKLNNKKIKIIKK